jgi:uncharacterized membrane protein YqgA involved in biofilm formation
VIGTTVNVSCIVLGSLLGLTKKTPLSTGTQNVFKVGLGAFTAMYGLRLTWLGLASGGSFLQGMKLLGLVVLALVAGKLAGRLLHLQKASNHLGRFARDRIAATKPDSPDHFHDGFLVCTALFCAAPLGILGCLCDGVSGDYLPLAAKAVMDGLAAMGFVSIFGWGTALSAVPVLVFQGTATLLCDRFIQPILQAHHLIDPVNATAGLIIFCVALLILEIRKIEVTNYLPSLCFAPLLAWWL